ncbi:MULTISPECIES: hypothetical protein [Pseudolactococcus]|jgi:hypothetical protein|nr:MULTISPECIES: hypothetical protein [Lactococcus]MBQ2635314.1 hypothetical protein [Methanobrevibacter sp.]MBQ2652980.1 hypothetical protein [Methanobrevibacter sp.]MCJ1971158.1 hypothetical protein [Lactococcus carnosus]
MIDTDLGQELITKVINDQKKTYEANIAFNNLVSQNESDLLKIDRLYRSLQLEYNSLVLDYNNNLSDMQKMENELVNLKEQIKKLI